MTATVAVTIAVAMSPTCVRVHRRVRMSRGVCVNRRVRTIRVVPRTSVRGMPCAVVVVVHSGLGYMAVSIEAVASVVVAPLVSYEYRRMSIVVAVPVVVGIDAERPSSCLPCHGTIEVGAAHILVILPGAEHNAASQRRQQNTPPAIQEMEQQVPDPHLRIVFLIQMYRIVPGTHL